MVDDPRIVNTISFWQNQELVDALISLPEPQLVEVIALALEAREAKVARPEWQSVKLVLAEAHRFNEKSAVPSPWTLLVLARPEYLDELVDEPCGPSQKGSCCGLEPVRIFVGEAVEQRVIHAPA
ncbi:hypothetical protein [Burkholderia pseudomultivorans]|uniref:Uncharacterized protein n=1 Tax=Burkholderia pseudomultivorans TaxID=1207504 RepID=A0ABU2EEF8_9BURK|nr:hypothetical protein [Burkholderia pseudomultivorans]MDR8731686.1 hypothetical protein [Burkholderia pseudomultivorans]MDR8739068.1 hypothetical protein [Burkholderia pseudomultivorans]MDR8745674.1 hypothetical protein [Burkholderia pseudomultivorans]MDR8758272.1 hypothetical protein [Burkholderia pseudomultivorans]MDR8781991.1 hypothetical protein [Burkholderia pseudomultivorans]